MKYIQRDASGSIIGVASTMQYEEIKEGEKPVPQAGWDLVPLQSDHPDIIKFESR